MNQASKPIPPAIKPCAYVVSTCLLWVACSEPMTHQTNLGAEAGRDLHSYARPDEIRVRHVAMDLTVSFEERTLVGWVTLTLARVASETDDLRLDTRDLDIRSVESARTDGAFAETSFQLDEEDPILGRALTINLPPDAVQVRIHYTTNPGASGLQWLEAEQTAGNEHPFLYTQSQAVHARSWIPVQDSPGVRVTYDAVIRTPKGVRAVMSADAHDDSPGAPEGEHRFLMSQPIPPYLIALAVGDLAFQPMSERTGVWAEPALVEQAAREFEDTEAMMQAVEKLYGPYRWGRYDILVLPPSFPFGGMENPRLTFATPTILAGDKSLVSLVAHELAHSWSGNLVTNATWRDFWLNEGFTVYLENRIQEEVFGPARAAMESSLEVDKLIEEIAELPEPDQILHVDLAGRDPDDGFTLVPYVKGMLFLLQLEKAVGREAFDDFLRGYFDHFAFQSITTADFIAYLEEHLLAAHPGAGAQVREWIEQPGLPKGYARPQSNELVTVTNQAEQWLAGHLPLGKVQTSEWTTQHWLAWLRALPEALERPKLDELDRAFNFTGSGNSEIHHEWLRIAVRSNYEPADAALEKFLTRVGRRKFLKPLYADLAKTPEGRRRAVEIYAKAKPTYHPIATATIDEILKDDKQ